MNINRIADIINNNYKTTITTVTKGGVKKTAIVIDNGTNIQPTFYPYDYEGSEEEIAMMILSTVKNMEMPSINIDFGSYKSVKPTLRVGIRPKVDDDNTVHRDYLDLDVYLYMQIDTEKSAKIKSALMEGWNIPESVVWADAISNTKKDMIVSSMREIMKDFGYDIDDMPDCVNQVVIKNENAFRSASALMMPDVLDLAAAKLNTTQIIILPSSIHELIVMANDGSHEYDNLNFMVTEINNTQVMPEERLSNHVYVYDTITKSVVCK